jgi:hypothetical protein
MTLWFHSTILATSLAATVAVGFASAAIYSEPAGNVATKSDRLEVVGETQTSYVTIETREDGVSVLNRVPLTQVTQLN